MSYVRSMTRLAAAAGLCLGAASGSVIMTSALAAGPVGAFTGQPCAPTIVAGTGASLPSCAIQDDGSGNNTGPAVSASGPPLNDGDVLDLAGSGFTPNQTVSAEECVVGANNPNTQCNGNTSNALGPADNSGNYVNEVTDPSGNTSGFSVFQLPGPTFPTSSIHCDSTHACEIWLTQDPTTFSSNHGIIDFQNAGVTGIVPESPLVPLLPLSGAAVLLGGALIIVYRRRNSATPTPAA
jgi:hypothetical protein